MLDQITATRFIKPMGNGRTKPVLVECETEDGKTVTVVLKCSASTMEGVKNLAIEAIAAMLGSDLELPVPEPFVVVATSDFIQSIPDEHAEIRASLTRSCMFAFGSKQITPGFAAWTTGGIVPEASCGQAAEIFTFDAIIVNADRRPLNPNCLFDGKQFAVFDHELTLCQKQLLFWREPWIEGGFDEISKPETHIFAKPSLSTCPNNLDRFAAAWSKITETRIDEYLTALPREWKMDQDFLTNTREYLLSVQTNITTIVNNALRALR